MICTSDESEKCPSPGIELPADCARVFVVSPMLAWKVADLHIHTLSQSELDETVRP